MYLMICRHVFDAMKGEGKEMISLGERYLFHVYTFRCGHAKMAPDEEYIKKAKLLINEGLYHVVYSPDNVQSSEYPFEEYDATSGSMKHYKKVPMNVTNDEFEQIKKYSTIDETPKNAISITLTVIAYIIFISGFIYGIYIGSEYYVDEFSFSLAFISWIITLISGMTFLGFAEIIKLLEAIKNK